MKLSFEWNQVINQEVDNLLAAGKIREVKYPEWLSNVVLVPNKNGKWRVCVDFKDLNKACPKDPFPLPHIDAMVDATARYEMLTFLDAWSGYNQIKMHPSDQEKTTFGSKRVTEAAVSAVLVREQKGSQHPVYYVSKSLLPAETRHLKVCCDSKLIVNHVNDSYEAGDSRMMAYLNVAKEFTLRFTTFNIKQIPKDQNAEVDALATLGATFKAGAISTIPIIHLLEPAILKPEQEAGVMCTTSSEEETPNWRKPYQDWLENDILAADKKEWGIDVVGPLPRAPGNKTYMLAMTDYFSKWIEAESSSEAKEAQVECLATKVYPQEPQANGQAEYSNKIIVENLKKKLEEMRGKWAEELPLVLWADRTTPKVATGQTPFSLVFGAEAVIPSEVRIPTHRYEYITEDRNQVEMARSLDTINELRTSAQIRMASYRQTVPRSYNKNVKVRTLQVGDLVARKVFQNTKNQRAGKFAYNWEGPYQVESIVGNGAYRLMTMEGQMVPRSWNIIHLKKYFI
ncbi:uncharacterized protein LOC141618765 [Silene latifolia]|uniref:uncharacterized protein LOC141618765 n=1 Tax=Silene latifolia TaxID=37657 RepID=UPI003D78622E